MNEKNKKILISVFIAILMITSIAGFIAFPQTKTIDEKKFYKDLEFTREGDRWTTDANNQKISVLINPEEIKEQDIKAKDLFSSQKIYISVNPKDNLGRISQELNNLFNLLNKRIITSCYSDIPGCESLLIKTCKDATNLNKVIIIKIENNTNIKYNPNCLEINGDEKEIVNIIDYLIVSSIKNE